jgi:His-Xaa-Ser system radical SAM maturase HxsB
MIRRNQLSSNPDVIVISNDLGDYGFADDNPNSIASVSARITALEQTSALSGLNAAILRTRKAFLLDGPSLHIFVITLRCDHSCGYCQVSRASENASGFDMSQADALAALDTVFQSPSPYLTIEFQGGEPALRFDLIRLIVEAAQRRNLVENRSLSFALVSTLHRLTTEDLEFCRDHAIAISTSLDGPQAVHNANRPNGTRDSHQRTIESLAKARAILGADSISALPTLTRAMLGDPKSLIDHYVEHGFRSIFLRPVSPYGFAIKTKKAIGYEMDEFLALYRAALDYILELNAKGIAIEETNAAIMLRHILTPFHSGYMDMGSPAGAGLGTLLYNYDGLVYPSDEARMAARTGDKRFELGAIGTSLDDLMASTAMQWLRTGAVAEELPKCGDCAFVPYCGADPVHHAVVHGDPIGDRPNSDFCQRHLGMFDVLFGYLKEADPTTTRTFDAWAFKKGRAELWPRVKLA